MSARVIEVIEVEMPCGRGVEDDPVRIVVTYYSKDGILLAERDEWLEGQKIQKT